MLIYWQFHRQPSLRLTESGTKRENIQWAAAVDGQKHYIDIRVWLEIGRLVWHDGKTWVAQITTWSNRDIHTRIFKPLSRLATTSDDHTSQQRIGNCDYNSHRQKQIGKPFPVPMSVFFSCNSKIWHKQPENKNLSCLSVGGNLLPHFEPCVPSECFHDVTKI